MRGVVEQVRILFRQIFPIFSKQERNAIIMLIFRQTLVLCASCAVGCPALKVKKMGKVESELLLRMVHQSTLAILTGATT